MEIEHPLLNRAGEHGFEVVLLKCDDSRSRVFRSQSHCELRLVDAGVGDCGYRPRVDDCEITISVLPYVRHKFDQIRIQCPFCKNVGDLNRWSQAPQYLDCRSVETDRLERCGLEQGQRIFSLLGNGGTHSRCDGCSLGHGLCDLDHLYAASIPGDYDPLDRGQVVVGVIVAPIQKQHKNLVFSRPEENAIGPLFEPPHLAAPRPLQLLHVTVDRRNFAAHVRRELVGRTLDTFELARRDRAFHPPLRKQDRHRLGPSQWSASCRGHRSTWPNLSDAPMSLDRPAEQSPNTCFARALCPTRQRRIDEVDATTPVARLRGGAPEARAWNVVAMTPRTSCSTTRPTCPSTRSGYRG